MFIGLGLSMVILNRNLYKFFYIPVFSVFFINQNLYAAPGCATTNTAGSTISTSLSDCGASNSVVNNFGNIYTIAGNGNNAVTLSGSGTNFTNTGNITSPDFGGIFATGNNLLITNSGNITTYFFSIYNSGTANIVNSGTITASANNGPAIANDGGKISSITNTGKILAIGANSPGIINYYYGNPLNTIEVINNAQGGNTPLIFSGGYAGAGMVYRLPNNYNIIINNSTSFGRLSVINAGTSQTTFGIYSGSTVNNGTYTSVLSGVNANNLTATSGTYGTGTWTLINSSGNIWDLVLAGYSNIVTGPSATDTQASLQNTATALKSTYALQNSVIANSLNYDCQVFDKNDVCVSAGGRNTNVQAGGVNNVSALLIAAYRAMPEVRLGAYLDQNLSVTSSSSPVVLGNGGPLFGFFGVWNQNPEGTETEVKVSASFGQKNATMTRAIVGTSEAGVGSSSLNNSGVQAIAKYGFAVTKDAMVSPYIGLRYSQGNMGSYAEAVSGTVTTPLTYAALNTNATTFMLGVHGKYKVTPEAVVQASVGLESDTSLNNGSLTATGLTGLTAINFNPNPVKTRPVAMLGTYYDIEKNHRVGVTGIYRQEPFQAIGSTTVLATYTVGL